MDCTIMVLLNHYRGLSKHSGDYNYVLQFLLNPYSGSLKTIWDYNCVLQL